MLARESRVQPPALDAFSDVPLFNTKAVVHQTGVPAPTLRAWERRYGILAPRRGENDYRLYSERDIAVVTWLRERVDSGMTISQAIALMRSLEPARRRGRRSTNAPASAKPTPPAPRLGQGEMVAALLGHLADLDELAARRVVLQALAVYSVEEVCLSLLTPSLHEVGRLWAEGKVTVTVEHFAAAMIRAQLEGLYHIAASDQTGALVLVGCSPGELHEIGALMLALCLRRAGQRVAYLGQSIEVDNLVQTIRAAKPAGVVLSATLPPHAEALLTVADAVRAETKTGTQLFFGGQGFAARPDLARAAAEHYVPLNAAEAAQEIRRRLAR